MFFEDPFFRPFSLQAKPFRPHRRENTSNLFIETIERPKNWIDHPFFSDIYQEPSSDLFSDFWSRRRRRKQQIPKRLTVIPSFEDDEGVMGERTLWQEDCKSRQERRRKERRVEEEENDFRFMNDLELEVPTTKAQCTFQNNTQIEDTKEATQNQVPEGDTAMSHKQRLERRVKEFGLKIDYNTAADGNCQFDSVARQLSLLHDAKISKEKVRKRVVSWIREKGKTFRLSQTDTLEDWIRATQSQSLDDYCDNMSKNGAWGDEITLLAACEAFRVDICVFSSSGEFFNFTF